MTKKIKKKEGRPTVMTTEVLAKLEYAFSIDATVEEACSLADISRDAFYDYLKKDPAFSDRIESLRMQPILAARERVVKGVKESYQNAMDYLKRKKRKEFGDSTDITSGGEKLPTPIMSLPSHVQGNNSHEESRETDEED